MPSSRLAAAASVALALALVASASADAAPGSGCRVREFRVVKHDGPVAVLKRSQHLSGRVVRTRYVVCWMPTRRRTFMTVADASADLGLDVSFYIVDRRFLGVQYTTQEPAGANVSAELYDARTGRKLHDTRACAGGTLVGIGFVGLAFLPRSASHRGGMAFACNESSSISGYRARVFLFRDRRSQSAETVEDVTAPYPPGVYVDGIGVATTLDGSALALTWVLVQPGEPPQVRSTLL